MCILWVGVGWSGNSFHLKNIAVKMNFLTRSDPIELNPPQLQKLYLIFIYLLYQNEFCG